MDSRLAVIKARYGLGEGAKYEPNPKCNRCHGTGERKVRPMKYLKSVHGDTTFCHCLFIEHSFSNEVGGMLSDFAKKMLKEMDGNG